MLLTFIKLPFAIKNFVLSIFEWLLYTGFTVNMKLKNIFCETYGKNWKQFGRNGQLT